MIMDSTLLSYEEMAKKFLKRFGGNNVKERLILMYYALPNALSYFALGNREYPLYLLRKTLSLTEPAMEKVRQNPTLLPFKLERKLREYEHFFRMLKWFLEYIERNDNNRPFKKFEEYFSWNQLSNLDEELIEDLNIVVPGVFYIERWLTDSTSREVEDTLFVLHPGCNIFLFFEGDCYTIFFNDRKYLFPFPEYKKIIWVRKESIEIANLINKNITVDQTRIEQVLRERQKFLLDLSYIHIEKLIKPFLSGTLHLIKPAGILNLRCIQGQDKT
jgi:hypothetical protein